MVSVRLLIGVLLPILLTIACVVTVILITGLLLNGVKIVERDVTVLADEISVINGGSVTVQIVSGIADAGAAFWNTGGDCDRFSLPGDSVRIGCGVSSVDGQITAVPALFWPRRLRVNVLLRTCVAPAPVVAGGAKQKNR